MAVLNKINRKNKRKKFRKETTPEIEIIKPHNTRTRINRKIVLGEGAHPDDDYKRKRPRRAPGQIIFKFDMEKIKSLESNEGDSIFNFIPSKTNQDQQVFELIPSITCNQLDLFTKNINPHIEAIQKLVNATFNFVRNYEFLMDSANEVLRMLHCYIEDTKSPFFSWKSKAYRPPFRRPEATRLLSDPNDNICRLAYIGRASVYPDSPGIAEADCLTVDKGHALTQPMLDQSIPLGYCLPLNEKERKIWLDFKKLDEGNPESAFINFAFKEDEKRSVTLVSVIAGFAVAAFNKACATHFKKDEHNNLHDFESMECKYVKDTTDYYFYMTIEAIEEGNLGVYEAIVVCSSDDGVRALLKFALTDRTPVGTKAMALSFFSCLRSLCKTLEFVSRQRFDMLYALHNATRGTYRGMVCTETILFEHHHKETMKGIRRVLSLNLQLLFQPDCTRTNDPDTWSVPDPELNTGMKPRNNGTPCRGYDYITTTIIPWAVQDAVAEASGKNELMYGKNREE